MFGEGELVGSRRVRWRLCVSSLLVHCERQRQEWGHSMLLDFSITP